MIVGHSSVSEHSKIYQCQRYALEKLFDIIPFYFFNSSLPVNVVRRSMLVIFCKKFKGGREGSSGFGYGKPCLSMVS